MLPNRIVVGAEADVTFPGFPNNAGISIGGTSNLTSPTLGAETFSETVLTSGTVRGRIGYAPGSWLFYATGGFAWTYDRLDADAACHRHDRIAVSVAIGLRGRCRRRGPGRAALDRAARISVHRLRQQQHDVLRGRPADRFQLRAARAARRLELSVRQRCAAGTDVVKASAAPDPDIVNFHGQTTFLEQAYPAFRSPYQGPNSLPGGGQGRETWDASLFAGVRLWRGAELWINPEIDQGFGLANTLGVAGFPSGEAYKVGQTYPYARLPRAFIRQTIDLGGESGKVEPGTNQFAGSQTANRLVLTVGKLAVVDIFDTNKYAHDPRNDFMNWAIVDTGTFDYAADAWGYTYGATAEWYQGNWTVRGGLFDLSIVPNSPDLDPSFRQVPVGRRNRATI